MNVEKAHEILENRQRRMTKYRNCYEDEDIESNGMAILALEKQIPKKPDFAGGRYVCKCGWDIYRDRQKYCLNCGCKLKWEEGE